MTPPFSLREWQLSDAASLAENANNLRVWENLRDALPHPYTEEDGRQWLATVVDMPQPATIFAIVVDGKAVGSVGFFPRTDVERITAELGYWLGEKYWGKGIVTAAVKQTVAYAFANFPELRKIYATPFGHNLASQKVLEKAGFVREAILRQAAIKCGKIEDEHYYS
ncbi:MAG: GNAT family N-acetyltransferase, partial [Prevotellaceae bacterium]|nr:GNAT family N-acetyltransferase [Prevotellaceae bacterium]